MSALFGYEGHKSILDVLKKKGWCTKLSADTEFQARNIQLFDIDVYLTKEGVNHVNDIIKLIFQVIFYLFY